MVSVVWKPLQGSQSLAMSFRGHEILIDGTRGGGKTDAQLMYFRQFVGRGYGEFWRGSIFDREYKNLDDLVARSKRWFYKFGDGAKFISSVATYKWVWPTGEELLFRTLKSDDDYWNYHGQEFPFIGFNELTKFPSPSLYESMKSCNRTSFIPDDTQEKMPVIMFSTANPYGAGHNWVKKKFVSKAPPGHVVKELFTVHNPRTNKEEEVIKTQVRLFSSWKENKYLSPEYIADLQSITDENKRKAWLSGDWDIVAGGAIDDVWDRNKHVIEPFDIPESWYLDRSFDWGSSSPFSVLWFAESNGEHTEGMPYYPKGSVFVIMEWYGAKDSDNSKGLYMNSPDIAEGILEAERAIKGVVNPGPADSSIYSKIDGNSIGELMEEGGVFWNKADKSPGSRVSGLEIVRLYLDNSKNDELERPGLYIFNICVKLIENLPVLPRDSKKFDDVDTKAIDHDYDALKYRLATKRIKANRVKGYY